MKAFITYEIPPLRSLNWMILEDEPGDPPLTEDDVRAWVAANQPLWRIKALKINPAVADLPVHLKFNGHDYVPIRDATKP